MVLSAFPLYQKLLVSISSSLWKIEFFLRFHFLQFTSFISVVETPENGGEDLLLSSEFLKECMEMYSVPSRGFETNPRVFPSKHLNIVDPLKENNNLGRSVSKG